MNCQWLSDTGAGITCWIVQYFCICAIFPKTDAYSKTNDHFGICFTFSPAPSNTSSIITTDLFYPAGHLPMCSPTDISYEVGVCGVGWNGIMEMVTTMSGKLR